MAKLHAEVVGAGFVGLTVAARLAQAGWSVRVHERSSEIRAFGAGIWIWDNGVQVLHAIDAADEALAGTRGIPRMWNMDGRDRMIHEIPFAELHSDSGPRMFCITRQQLLMAIHGAAKRAGGGVRHRLAHRARGTGWHHPCRRRQDLARPSRRRRRRRALEGARFAGPVPRAPRAHRRRDPGARRPRARPHRQAGVVVPARVVEWQPAHPLQPLRGECVLALLAAQRRDERGSRSWTSPRGASRSRLSPTSSRASAARRATTSSRP